MMNPKKKRQTLKKRKNKWTWIPKTVVSRAQKGKRRQVEKSKQSYQYMYNVTPKAKDKMEKKAESNVELLAAKDILTSSLSDQFGKNVTSESNIPVPEDTPLTSTWALCSQQLDVPEFRPNVETLSSPLLPGNLCL